MDSLKGMVEDVVAQLDYLMGVSANPEGDYDEIPEARDRLTRAIVDLIQFLRATP